MKLTGATGRGMVVAGCLLAVLGGASCKREGEEGATALQVVPAGEQAVPAEVPRPDPARPTWTTANAGFASRLPEDVSFYADARHLGRLWDLAVQIGGDLKALADRADLDDLEALAEQADLGDLDVEAAAELAERVRDEGGMVLRALSGEESFVALRGLDLPLELIESYTVLSNRFMGKLMTEVAARGNFDELGSGEMLADIATLVGKAVRKRLEAADGVPPLALYVGGKVPADQRGAVVAQIAKWLEEAAGESGRIEPHRFERAGTSWSGIRIPLTDLETAIESDGFQEMGAPEVWRDLIETVAGWEVVVACGEVDGYVVVYAGLGEDSLAMADDPAKSLAASDSFRFFEGRDPQTILGTWWMDRRLIRSIHRLQSYIYMAEGVEEGLKASPGLKRGAEMLTTLKEFLAHWRARREGVAHDLVGALIYGGGLRAESRGGWQGAGLDLESPLRFASGLADLGQDLFLRAHWKMKDDYLAHGREQTRTGLKFLRLAGAELMEALAGQAAGEEDPNEFESRSRDLMKGLEDFWEGYGEHFAKALGPEAAFVMDLRGILPAVVGVDEEVLEAGRIPRLVFLRPVRDRAALGEAWKLWNRAGTNLFGLLADAIEQPIPFPDTMTAEKDDLATHFIPFPFAADDFLPSVSVSDDLFMMGTSKPLAESLYEHLLDAKQAETEAGLWVDLHANTLWDFCQTWIDIKAAEWAIDPETLDEALDEAGEEDPGEDPQEDLKALLDKARWFRGFSYRRWLDHGVPRSTWHLKWGDPAPPRALPARS